MKFYIGLLLLTQLLAVTINAQPQLPYKLMDGRSHRYCEACTSIIENMPKEVLFGISITDKGEVFFSMTNREWFDKIFKSDAYGVSVDLVSKERYACDASTPQGNTIPKGFMLFPVYRNDLLKNLEPGVGTSVLVKVGNVPDNLKSKELEGNLVILNGNMICFYTNFINIDRSAWKLLPMGLYADTLVKDISIDSNKDSSFFTYSTKQQITIPFEKASSDFNSGYVTALLDSIHLEKYHLRKVDIRVYSSVEGSEQFNKTLMQKRGDMLLQMLRKYNPNLGRVNIVHAEDWIDFFDYTRSNKLAGFNDLTKTAIKKKLDDQSILTTLEPQLATERKAILTLYLENKTGLSYSDEEELYTAFNQAVAAKKYSTAQLIQRELVEQVMDNRIPVSSLNRLQVPETKDFSMLLNDREVYRYLLKATSEYEALQNFLYLKTLDPLNGHINYNICSLQFFMWQYGGDSTVKIHLAEEINRLPSMGIERQLTKRMLINYHILSSEDDLQALRYEQKDSSIGFIRNTYDSINLSDEEIYSLAKYFAAYSLPNWSREIIEPRINQIDVSENLVFYYLNLLFYFPGKYDAPGFNNALLQAINLNPKRFCAFFRPNDKGGAAMQLLDYDILKKFYCETCR